MHNRDERNRGTMAESPIVPEYSQVSLKSLKLRPGMFLQAEGVEEDSLNYEMQYLGVIEDKCVMLVPVGLVSLKFGMKAGEIYVIRGFTGLYDFHFTSTVIHAFDFTFRVPAYAYAVLSFPDVVEAKKVRNAVRIKTSLPGMAKPHGSDTPQLVTLVDLSADGALVRSPVALGAIGDLVRLDFSLGSDIDVPHLATLARVCHSSEGAGDDGFLTGLLFENISAAAKLRVKEFVLSNLE
jgi:hypothetical protein